MSPDLEQATREYEEALLLAGHAQVEVARLRRLVVELTRAER